MVVLNKFPGFSAGATITTASIASMVPGSQLVIDYPDLNNNPSQFSLTVIAQDSPSIYISGYLEDNVDSFLSLASDSSTKIVGQTCQTEEDTYITKASFWMKKNVSPIGNIEARIYNTIGTCGVNAVPTGNAIAYSELVPTTALSTSPSWVDFVFAPPGVLVSSASSIAIATCYTSSSLPNAVQVGIDITDPVHGGNYFDDDPAPWAAKSNADTIHIFSGSVPQPDYKVRSVGERIMKINGGDEYIDEFAFRLDDKTRGILYSNIICTEVTASMVTYG